MSLDDDEDDDNKKPYSTHDLEYRQKIRKNRASDLQSISEM
jgi:hypothetical protein